MNGDQKQHDTVQRAIQPWIDTGMYLTLMLGADAPSSNVRIFFGHPQSWSHLGDECNSIPKHHPVRNHPMYEYNIVCLFC
jgi:hypothetical protein